MGVEAVDGQRTVPETRKVESEGLMAPSVHKPRDKGLNHSPRNLRSGDSAHCFPLSQT